MWFTVCDWKFLVVLYMLRIQRRREYTAASHCLSLENNNGHFSYEGSSREPLAPVRERTLVPMVFRGP